MPRPAAVILNVYSGPRRRTAHSEIVDLLREHGVEARIFPAGDGAGVVAGVERAIGEGYTTVVAAGGDGTVGTVAAALAGRPAVLAVLPLGTYNHFAKDLGVPPDVAGAVAVLKSGRTAEVDVASVNGRVFVNTSSIGLYPRLVLEREHYRRTGLGRAPALAAATISALRRFSRIYVRVAAEGEEWEGFAPFVFVGNNRYVFEGSRVASRLSLTDGLLSVCLSGQVGRWGFLRMAAEAWLGGLTRDPNFRTMTTRRLWVDCNRRTLHVSLDGEVTRMATPLHYQVLPRALRVVVP